jgi:hypothetical protein
MYYIIFSMLSKLVYDLRRARGFLYYRFKIPVQLTSRYYLLCTLLLHWKVQPVYLRSTIITSLIIYTSTISLSMSSLDAKANF